jgi:C4-dicarboxylate-specific signal transduction histidine kinase
MTMNNHLRDLVKKRFNVDIDVFTIEESVRRLDKSVERRITERTAQLTALNKELEKKITEYKRREGDLRNLALIDDLTGLYNRRGFLTLAEHQWK